MKEYPAPYQPGASRGSLPYYPIPNKENQALYQRYRQALARFPSLHLCGRLAEYRYCNMDAAVASAMALAEALGQGG